MTEQAVWRVVWRGIVLAFALILLALLFRELQSVIVQLLLAVLLAAAATPLVDRISAEHHQRWRPGRGLGASLVFLGAVLFLGLLSEAVVAAVLPDLRGLAARVPEYATRVQVAIDDGVNGNPELASTLNGMLPSVADLAGGAAALASQAPRLVGVATGLASGLLHVVFTLVLALYLTIDGDRIRRYAVTFLPFERHEQALDLTERIGTRLGAWARGEAVLMAIIGMLTWIGASLIGLPYAAALALIAGVGEVIPTVGPIVAAIPLVAVGLLASPAQGLLALLVAILVQQLENNLIVPRVMGQAVDLHPVVVMLAILAGGELLGVPGALLAVPVVASLSVVVDEVQRERWARRQASKAVARRQASRAARRTPQRSQAMLPSGLRRNSARPPVQGASSATS
jgi:predicted PurR-regulated permease PerM